MRSAWGAAPVLHDLGGALERFSTQALWFYGALVLLEVALELRGKTRFYRLWDTLCSIATGLGYTAVQVLMRGVFFGAIFFASQLAPWSFETTPLTFLLCYLAVDFAFYWHHRVLHEVRLGWAAHVVHHSSTQYNLGATALRQSVFEALYEPWFYVPLALLGFEPLAIMLALQINITYMFWPHTQHIGRLPRWFEAVFVTPSHHRVHHAKNLPYLDKNYGGTFILWDKLFGTFAQEREAPEFGVLTPIRSANPLTVTFASWGALLRDLRHTPGLGNKVQLLLRPPGWAPEGRGLTTRQMQAAGVRTEGAPLA
jgi:sterol desaturase/sphingolipid hydroxylase (fatty acid hydroxylase superfamily)